MDELGLEWSPPEEPTRSHLDEWFLPGRRQAPHQRSSPFFPEIHKELTRSWRAPYSACQRAFSSSALTSVDGAEEKGYEKMPPLDESVAHIFPRPRPSVGRQRPPTRLSHVRPLQFSLDVPTHRLDKRPRPPGLSGQTPPLHERVWPRTRSIQ